MQISSHVEVECKKNGERAESNARAFVDDPSLKEAMGRAGVVGAPRIEFYEETNR